MSFAYSVDRILQIVGHDAKCIGEYTGEIVGIASLSTAAVGDLSFLGNSKYVDDVRSSIASVLLLPKSYKGEPRKDQLHIRLDSPSYALALLCRDIEKALQPKAAPGIHPTACVDKGSAISPTASVGPFCHIGEGAVIGDSVVLGTHVSIGRFAKIENETYVFSQVVVGDYCEIGARNRLYSGCVIGSDGYGYEFREGAHQRVPQIGKVVTESDVDVGANTTIDRARFGSTRIGRGTKIDNQVQIGHNVQVGRNCLIVAQVGISGSTILGDGVVLGGQTGVAGHLKIGSGAMAAGATGIGRSLKPNEKVRGPNSDPFALYSRVLILQRRLPELFKRFSKLEKSVESLTEGRVDQ